MLLQALWVVFYLSPTERSIEKELQCGATVVALVKQLQWKICNLEENQGNAISSWSTSSFV
jgi:hypothetical protein